MDANPLKTPSAFLFYPQDLLVSTLDISNQLCYASSNKQEATMGDLPLDKLWQWWTELSQRAVKLHRQWKPLADEYERLERKRAQLEQLIRLEEGEPEGSRKVAEAWARIQEGGDIIPVERKPPDIAYDILLQETKPMHYRKLVERIKEQGIAVGGRDPGSTLIAYLGRDKRFAKAKEVGRGYYKLKEWGKE